MDFAIHVCSQSQSRRGGCGAIEWVLFSQYAQLYLDLGKVQQLSVACIQDSLLAYAFARIQCSPIPFICPWNSLKKTSWTTLLRAKMYNRDENCPSGIVFVPFPNARYTNTHFPSGSRRLEEARCRCGREGTSMPFPG